jgi:hypothetical protein
MRKRILSQEELHRIIALKQVKNSWLKIERDTGVPRQIARRAYDQWQSSQARDQLSDARKQVAAEEFRKHLKELNQLADSLVLSLYIPVSPVETMKADTLLNAVWQMDLSRNEQTERIVTDFSTERRQRQTERRNRMLLQSLKEHTRGKVRWEALDQWEKSWDNCINYLLELKNNCRELIDGYLSLKKGVKKEISTKDSLEELKDKILETVLEFIWKGNPGYDLEKKPTWFNVKEYQESIFKVSAPGHPAIVFNFRTQNLGLDVADVCNLTAFNLFSTKPVILDKISNELKTMRKSIDDLEFMLDPLRLRPLVLSSRCELCPA